MSASISEVLLAMRSGFSTSGTIAVRLGTDEEEVRTVLDLMASLGYIEDAAPECGSCPREVCKECPLIEVQRPQIATFKLTEKGRRTLERVDSRRSVNKF